MESRIIYLHILWILAVLQVVAGEVDQRSPNYSLFRGPLRKVNKPKLSPLATKKAEASMNICEVLASVQYTIRCPTLAYIYRDLASGKQQSELSRKTIEGIAYVVTNSEEARGPLSIDDARSFMDSIASLELMRPTSDVVLTMIDLSECLTWNFGDNKEVNKFLYGSQRASVLDRIFNNLGGPIPLRPNRHLVPHFHVTEDDIKQASDFVSGITGKKIAPKESRIEEQKEQVEAEAPAETVLDQAQLTLLRMMKMQMESRAGNRYEQKVPIDSNLATKFIKFWSNLKSAKLDSNTALDRKAIEFRDDPKNVELEAELQQLLVDYNELTDLVASLEINLHQKGTGRELPELIRTQIDRADELFAKIGDSIDVGKLRANYDACKKEYRHYSTMDNFINSSSW